MTWVLLILILWALADIYLLRRKIYKSIDIIADLIDKQKNTLETNRRQIYSINKEISELKEKTDAAWSVLYKLDSKFKISEWK